MSRLIHGHGPAPCSQMIVGSEPGWEEDKRGLPFVGKTGDELDRHLDGVRLPTREHWFLSNIYRFYGGKKYKYTNEDLLQGASFLLREYERVKPRLIVPLGRAATRYHLGDVDMDSTQGIPWLLPKNAELPAWGNILDPDNTVVFPIVHPAAGFHNPEMSPYVVSGFHELGEYFAGRIEPRRLYDDPYPEPHYEEITTVERLEAVLAECGQQQMSIDTEGSPARPWSLQFSTQPGVAYLIRKNRTDLLACYRHFLELVRPRLTYHSALHDLSMMRALGLPTDLEFDDTMVMAYLLQIAPQGLKPLCVRECNMAMKSYDEVLGDASQRLALDYVQGLWDIEQMDWEAAREDAFWAEIDKGRKIKVYPKLPKTALHKATERALRSKDARKLWGNQVEDIQVAGYTRLGSMPEPTLDHVPVAEAIQYGSRDADGTTRIRSILAGRIQSMGLEDVYKLELGTYPLIDRMHHIGIKPDLDYFATFSENLQGEIDALQWLVGEQTGDPTFNCNSGDQVADYLFEQLMLEGIGKKTDEGRFSTNDKVLEALEREHPEFPVISDIRAYRETYKLKNTFVDRLPDFVRRWPYDGRIHATFRTTRVITGRLAASDPNLLAMPKHGKFAKGFRRGWIPELGHILAEWDLSQIELRVLAHLSQDPVLLAVYRGELRNPDGSEIDLHANLAQRIFGGSPADHKKGTGRLAAKAINFGLPMGMTYKGLTVELRKNGVFVTEDEAQRWIDETMRLYAGVPIYQAAKIAEAEKNGFVRCLSGRVRYVGGIRSRDERVRAEAGRFAFSTPIQEGAQWLMKQAETRLYQDILMPYWKDNRWVEPLVQIHDALTLECEDDPVLAQDLNRKMVQNMTQAPAGFSVPIGTSGDWGYNWQDLRDFDAT